MFVLDASVVLALVNGEKGADDAAQYLAEASISAVNLSEIVAKLAERGMPADAIRDTIADLNLDVRPFTSDLAVSTGLLRASTRSLGLSLGDRACLALASETGGTAITMDRAWQMRDIDVAVVIIER